VSNVHPSTEVMLRVTEFSKDVHDTVFGVKDKNFVQASRDTYSEFKEAIMMTTPDFRPFEGSRLGRSLVSSHTPPRDLAYVRKVIKECVDQTIYRVLDAHSFVGQSLGSFHDMSLSRQPRRWLCNTPHGGRFQP